MELSKKVAREKDKPYYEQAKVSPTIYAWEVMVPYLPRWIRAAMSLFAILVIPVATTLFGDNWFLSFLLFIFSLPIAWLCYYVISADYHYQYRLTEYGIECSWYQKVPKIAYSIDKFFGFIAAPVCLIAIVVVGPLALVGAGGFALMALKGKPRTPGKTEDFIAIHSELKYLFFYDREYRRMFLIADPDFFTYGYYFYCGSFLDDLKKYILPYYNQYEYYEVDDDKEMLGHSRYIEAQKSARKIKANDPSIPEYY
ncbi:hypothetical protein [Celerinatantimonas yamalensis]|uniref:Uncharacterized protein n=1 Tax=Celerinatantimonas yamalensis TaxID=559956 RepID=A0ABW9G6R4_9GAMM